MKRKTKNERAKVMTEETPKDQIPNDNVESLSEGSKGIELDTLASGIPSLNEEIINDEVKSEEEFTGEVEQSNNSKACEPDSFIDGSEITCSEYDSEIDTHIWTFGFTTEIKGVKKKCTGVCTAPDDEKTAWLKVIKTMSEMYPTLEFTYSQNLQKKKIGE